MARTISIYGVTGSVGQSATRLIAGNNDYQVETLTGHNNVTAMIKAIDALSPKSIVMGTPEAADEIKHARPDFAGSVHSGTEALHGAAEETVDISLQAIVGFAGVRTSVIAAKNSKKVALANKESLVCAGALLKKSCKEYGAELLPVDSEHAALHQCLGTRPISDIKRLILTASGGPFLNATKEEMAKATPETAAKHPNWDMGQRISIDSASMFNKAMEMIEAYELFDVSPDQVDAIVHPQSLIHSLIEWQDNSMLAQLSVTDMIGPISYALAFPEFGKPALPQLDLLSIPALQFEAIDPDRFPAIDLAKQVMEVGGLMGTVFNAAKEVALDRFLAREIGFLDMANIVNQTIGHFLNENMGDTFCIDTIHDVNQQARRRAFEIACG